MHGQTDGEAWPSELLPLPRLGDWPVPLAWNVTDRGIVPRPSWLGHCLQNNKCWVCGRKLPRDAAFVLDAAHVILALATDPPAHVGCIEFPLRRLSWSRGVVAVWTTHAWQRLGSIVGWHRDAALSLSRPTRLVWFRAGQEIEPAAAQEPLMEAANVLLHRLPKNTTEQMRKDFAELIADARSLLNRRSR